MSCRLECIGFNFSLNNYTYFWKQNFQNTIYLLIHIGTYYRYYTFFSFKKKNGRNVYERLWDYPAGSFFLDFFFFFADLWALSPWFFGYSPRNKTFSQYRNPNYNAYNALKIYGESGVRHPVLLFIYYSLFLLLKVIQIIPFFYLLFFKDT